MFNQNTGLPKRSLAGKDFVNKFKELGLPG
jgi:hypothetical protein